MTIQDKRRINVRDNTQEYRQIHKWLRRNFGDADICEMDNNHKSNKYEWANISGNYLKDINDWKKMCPSCHRKYDVTEELREKMKITNKGKSKRHRPVTQFSKDGKIMDEHLSIVSASKKTGIIRTAIMNCLQGRAKTAGKCLWGYRKELL